MKRKSRVKINKLKLVMIILVFSMVIGFAALNTELNFFGTSTIAFGENDFRVYISRAFINDVGKSNIINENKDAFTFTYSDINRKNADLKYTVKNTSNSYYADVEVSCKSRKNDGTSFLYNEENYESQKFRIEPGKSLTKDVKLFLPNADLNLISENSDILLLDHIKGISKGSDSNINFDTSNGTGVYESTSANSGNKVYYYRGATANNDVIFADKCWKILRTSENGGIKLVYNGNSIGGTCTEFSSSLGILSDEEVIEITSSQKFNNNAYAGYMYGGLNSSDYLGAHSNINDSYFKQKLDDWYERFILNTEYEKYVIDDSYYNNRTILNDYSKVTSTDTFEGLGYGTHTTLYESAGRSSSLAKTLSPTYKVNNINDNFTVSNSNGNGKLGYPIGMLTSDELVYAGVTKDASNKSWLEAYKRFILTMSPVGYYNNTMNFAALSGRVLKAYPSDVEDESAYVLPVLTVSPDLYIVSGDGTASSPFVLSSEDTYENSYTCSLNVNKVGYSEDIEPRNPLLDLEIGEEYCFDEECFYTISNDNKGTIKMIAKYNLYVGSNYADYSNPTAITKTDVLYGKQHYTAIGTPPSGAYPHIATVPYSKNTTDNTYVNSVVKTYVDEYGKYLQDITGINVTAELITRDELVDLGCVVLSKTDGNCNNPKFDWVTSTTYWTMTPENGTVYLVGSDGYFKAPTTQVNLTASMFRGVRPVITISLPSKNPDVTFVTGNGETPGDELCIGDECFYILNYDGDNYTLFSKYNLYVGNEYSSGSAKAIATTDPLYGKQSALALGDKGSPIYGTLNHTDAVNAISNYSTYLNSTYGLHTTSRPISKDELVGIVGCVEGFKNSNGENRGCSPIENPSVKYEWVTNTTYWGSASGTGAYLVGGDGYFGVVGSASLSNNTFRGARPVIVIPASEIKNPDYVVDDKTKYPESWNDNGIFSEYYEQAYEKLKTMTTEEKIGQLLVVSYSNGNPSDAEKAIQSYHVGGVLFFADAFEGKSEAQVISMTSSLQAKSKIPLMMQVDEEGGIVTRMARNTNLVSSELQTYPNLFKTYTRTINNVTTSFNGFKSPSDLYKDSGYNFELVKQETQVKNSVLKRLGLNINLAPVSDIADSSSYIYPRTLGQDAVTTGEFVKTVVENSKNSGVSHSLKHFPGYGNNSDTHTSSSVDETSLEELKNKHLVPFVSGINAGVESVLISHNIISALDKDNPASLSYAVHSLLFDDLGFTGLAITDDLSMNASSGISNTYIKAYTAGNHILLTSDKYATAYSEILEAVQSGNVSLSDLNQRVFKVLAWKYYVGILS